MWEGRILSAVEEATKVEVEARTAVLGEVAEEAEEEEAIKGTGNNDAARRIVSSRL